MSTPNKTRSYNGWSNYETWLVNLWLTNEQADYASFSELLAEPLSDHEKAERLEEMVRDRYVFEPYGMIADLVNAAFMRVEWREIIERNRE